MGWMQLAGAGISALAQMDAADKQKDASVANATAIEADSALKAAKIRKLSDQVRGSARSATAASGVDVNSASAKVIDESIQSNTGEDVMNTILTGKRQARSILRGGQAVQTAGGINALGTVANAFNSDYGRDALSRFSGWKTAAKTGGVGAAE